VALGECGFLFPRFAKTFFYFVKKQQSTLSKISKEDVKKQQSTLSKIDKLYNVKENNVKGK
jgi:hypothetical protein